MEIEHCLYMQASFLVLHFAFNCATLSVTLAGPEQVWLILGWFKTWKDDTTGILFVVDHPM